MLAVVFICLKFALFSTVIVPALLILSVSVMFPPDFTVKEVEAATSKLLAVTVVVISGYTLALAMLTFDTVVGTPLDQFPAVVQAVVLAPPVHVVSILSPI